MFEKEDIVYKYTDKEAIVDGILFDVNTLNDGFSKSMFNYVWFGRLKYFNFNNAK